MPVWGTSAQKIICFRRKRRLKRFARFKKVLNGLAVLIISVFTALKPHCYDIDIQEKAFDWFRQHL